MVYIDWKRILALTPENFGEDEKEELLETVVWYTPVSDTNRKQLIALLKVVQEILKYKAEQVESLMSALDELAVKQGEEVARGRQELLDEIDDLREQLDYQKRLERDSGVSDDQLRSEVVRLEMQNEELVLELQEREKDMVTEKAEAEQLVSQVARLEREKLELSRELAAFQEESSERRGRSMTDSPDGSTERVEELVEMVRQKNKHIMQLLDDVEAIEQDNGKLRVQLRTVREELTEANNSVADLTQQTTSLKIQIEDGERNYNALEDKNKALASQVDELIQKKAKNDRDLDDFALKLNERVEEWKRLLDLKDLEIIKIKEELEKRVTVSTPWSETNVDSETKWQISQQEEEVLKLNKYIQELKLEKDQLFCALEELRNNSADDKSNIQAAQTIALLKENIKQLTEQLKIVEDDTTKKSEEISELVVQVRAYEREEFGLTEAIEKIKKLEKRLQDRDIKIENLVATCNKLSIEKGNFEDENSYLREKLGLSPAHIIDSSSVRRKSESDAQTINDLRAEVERLNNEVIELKLRNREMKSQLKSGLDNKAVLPIFKINNNAHNNKDTEKDDSEQKYLQLLEENDAMRKGLHEILDSLQSQTMGDLEAKSLERLLQALDARHVSGWYHPAMRLQAQVHTVKGECRELRIQVGALRKENRFLSNNFETAKAVNAALEEKIHVQASPGHTGEEKRVNKNQSDVDVEMENRCMRLEIALSQSKMCQEKAEASWERERRNLIKERDTLTAEVEGFKNPVLGETLSSAQVGVLMKTIDLVKNREEILEIELDEIRDSSLKKEEESLQQIIILQREKLELTIQIKNLKNQLIFHEPAEKVLKIERELALVKVRCNEAFNFVFVKKKEDNNKITPPSGSDTEMHAIQAEMKKIKEKLHDAEAQLNCYGDSIVTPDTFNNQLAILSSKLASCEIEVSSEKNKNAALERYCEKLKKVQTESEEQLADLLQQVQDNSNVNTKLQEAVLELESQLMTDIIARDGQEKVRELEAKCETLLLEKRSVEELLEMSRSQCRSLQSWKESKRVERDALSECLNTIEADVCEKFAVARLSQELFVERSRGLNLKKTISDSHEIISRLTSDNIAKDGIIISCKEEIHQMHEKNIKHFKILYKLLNRIHSASSNAFCFPTINRAYNIMSELSEQRKEFSEKIEALKAKEHVLEIKDSELQIQLEALHDLKAAFQSDPKNLITWHNKTTELRLKETRLKRQNQYLIEEVHQLNAHLKRMKEEATLLEEEYVGREREWEEKQIQWENSQLELCELIDGEIGGRLGLKQKGSSEDKERCMITQLESQVAVLQQQNLELGKEMEQKETVFREKLAEKIYRPKANHTESNLVLSKTVETEGESEKQALTVTVNSLQATIKQKERTIVRYQELLKKSREDHGNAMRRAQNELRNVHNALAQQSKSYSRMKHGIYQPASEDIEKYIIKIQELEEELAELQGRLVRTGSELNAILHEKDKWRKIAEERGTELEEFKERMETEIDRYREETHNFQMEAQQLRELALGGQTQVLIDKISDLQLKLSQYGERAVRPLSARKPLEREEISPSDSASDKSFRRQLKTCREECARLRDQIKSLQNMKRRQSSARPPEKKENLVDKIRKLEETLQLSKQHEQELEEKGLKKIRSVEEVTRWDERKRNQKTIERLQAKLKQKEVETTVAINKLETMRGLMAKMEREKAMLEVHIKNVVDSSRENTQFEILMTEKAKLAAQVAGLEEELACIKQHEGGKTAVHLHSKLEEQERIIANLELADKNPKSLTMELGRLQVNTATLEKKCIHLENENSTLKLNFEKIKEDYRVLRDAYRRNEEESKALKPTLSKNSPSRAQIRMSYELQRELNKLKGDLKLARDRLSITVQHNVELEEEIQRLRSKLSLWEEKDLTDTLARTNQQQMVSQLNQELIQVKSQLAHKIHLLDRVKILLSKAAAKEKALNEKVFALQSMVPST